MLKYLIHLLHIFVIAPLLIGLATNTVPQEVKTFVIYLAYFLVIYHVYKLIQMQEHLCETGTVHVITLFDTYSGIDKNDITIKQGDTVTWINNGDIEHKLNSTDGHFTSGLLKPNERYSLTFNFIGNFHYYCQFNKGWMKGIIRVVDNTYCLTC